MDMSFGIQIRRDKKAKLWMLAGQKKIWDTFKGNDQQLGRSAQGLHWAGKQRCAAREQGAALCQVQFQKS